MLHGGGPCLCRDVAEDVAHDAVETVERLGRHAEALVVLVEDAGQWEKVRAVRDRLPALQRVVLM